MKFLFNPSSKELTISAILYFLFGLILCFLHANILLWATRLVGLFIFLCGLYFFYQYFFHQEPILYIPLFQGGFCVVLGLFFLLSPESVLSILPILTGILFLFNACIHLRKAITLKRYGFSDWTFSLLNAVFIFMAGILMLSKPIQTLSFILKLIGVCLIVEAIVLLITKHKLHQYDLLD